MAPLSAKDNIMLARTVEAVCHLRYEQEIIHKAKSITEDDQEIGTHYEQIAEKVWHLMSSTERALFANRQTTRGIEEGGGSFVQADVLRQLQRRTGTTLGLTHSRYGGDYFTFLVPTADVKIGYSEFPAPNETLERFRYLPASGDSTTPPELDLDHAHTLLSLARDCAEIVRKGPTALDDETAMEIFDLVTSPEGRWAIQQELSATRGSDRVPVRRIHRLLRNYFHGRGTYHNALKQRLIGGNTVTTRPGKGAARLIGGALPGQSNQTLGREMSALSQHRIEDTPGPKS